MLSFSPENAGTEVAAGLQERFVDHPLVPGMDTVLSYSRFLTRTLANDEELVEWILSQPISRSWQPGTLTTLVADRLGTVDGKDELYAALRILRRRCMSMIAWADLAGVYHLADTLAAVSELADALIGGALERLHCSQCERFGTPMGRYSGKPVSMVVLGLGKLGGRELNFSSDVDLIFCFTEAGETSGSRPLSNEEFFIRLGRKLVQFLDEPADEGFVFRTDMRLRPNGAAGPLALSFDAMEHYYQTHGRDWERYAMIKARVVAGDVEKGSHFLEVLRPFIYRKYLDFSAFESIRDMKHLIDRELRRKGRQTNIKLGRGGIREIEFIVQSHQLIRGGREPLLQTTGLYGAFEALVELGVVPAKEVAKLLEAYAFLRNTEHRLQMYEDLQTQNLPASDQQRELLAWSMGYSNWEVFKPELDSRQNYVHERFSHLFQIAENDPTSEVDGFSDIWFEILQSEDAVMFLSEDGFVEATHAYELVRGIRHGRVYQSFSRNGRERLDRMMPLALRRIAATRKPDQSLIRFITVIEGIGRRSAYFALLAENQLALKQLIDLISTSPWIATWISRHPVILDELLDPIANAELLTPERITTELVRRMAQAKGDMEVQMDTLREYKNSYFLRVAALATAGVLEPMGVRHGLSDLAEVMLGEVIEVSGASLSARVLDQVDGILPDLQFGVLAYGKLGGRELSYNSDLDLVFLFDVDGDRISVTDPVLGYYFSRLAQRIMHVLTTVTRAGVLYETDIRLRPSGRSGTMVSSLNAFRDYQQQQAWTWEHLALVRARMICAPLELVEQFERARTQVLGQKRNSRQLRQDVVDMRRRMSEANSKSTDKEFDLKLGDDGLVDIEFLAQYLVLANAFEYPAILKPRSTDEILVALSEANIISLEDSEVLRHAYTCYLALELDLKLQERAALVDNSELKPERTRVREIWTRELGNEHRV